MPNPCWSLLLAAMLASGQDAAPFLPAPQEPWKPAWELTFRGDRLADPEEAGESFRRAGIQLRLRWSWELDQVRLEAGTRSAMGSDSNRLNAPRWDQQPSNGSQLDVIRGVASWLTEQTFSSLSLGFQENGLMTSQALWDRDLRFLGAVATAGLRSANGLVQEAGIRAEAGRVRNILGGNGDLAAAQVVLKMDTGSWSWSAHVDRWTLAWDPGGERLRRLPGHDPTARQRMALDAVGASGRWNTVLPLEARWFRSRNRATGESSEEAQMTAGSTERIYWPAFSCTWQRLSSTGTLYPVNGDEWWFYRRARGPRFDVSMPLPGQWLASLVLLRQTADGDSYQVTRTMVLLVKRF